MTMSKRTVVVGLSGGVDSSVAALLLKQQGWNVVGLFMKNWEDDDDEEYCSSRQDLIDVMSVADKIGIDVEVVNFAKEYKELVLPNSSRNIRQGARPIPMCCVIRKSSSKHFSSMRSGWGRRRSPPDIMLAFVSSTAASSCSRLRTVPRTRAIFCIG